MIIFPTLNHYTYGYRYTPAVAPNFSSDLDLVREKLSEHTFLLLEENTLNSAFYEVYEDRTHAISILRKDETKDANLNHAELATLGKQEFILPENYVLSKIITSSKSDNSDRIYIYTYRK